MTDLEMTRLCAESMGIEVALLPDGSAYEIPNLSDYPNEYYDPFHDDDQVMALVKRHHVALGWNHPGWGAFRQDIKRWVNDDDLNRAIVECVAKMRAAKVKP